MPILTVGDSKAMTTYMEVSLSDLNDLFTKRRFYLGSFCILLSFGEGRNEVSFLCKYQLWRHYTGKQ